MKKILILVSLFAILCVSCGKSSKPVDVIVTDTTAIAVDTVQVDTATVVAPTK